VKPMRLSILLSAGGLVLGGSLPSSIALGHVDRPCPCSYPGGVAQQGETVCLNIDGRQVLARCGMVLNNSAWRVSGERCEPTASSRPPRSPAAG